MNRCFDCAYCSTYTYLPVDVCDIDNHEIMDVYHDCCDKFVMAEEEDT